jgi:hypothetical protein
MDEHRLLLYCNQPMGRVLNNTNDAAPTAELSLHYEVNWSHVMKCLMTVTTMKGGR